jgi:hypothetical protein
MSNFSIRYWEEIPIQQLLPTGDAVSYKAGEMFFIQAVPERPDDTHLPINNVVGIYRVEKALTLRITYQDVAELQAHIDQEDIHKADKLDPTPDKVDKIAAWKTLYEYYTSGDLVYNSNGTNPFKQYYKCVVEKIEEPQVIFNVWKDGSYPQNPHNPIPEYVTSGIKNEGFYLVARGPHSQLAYLPRWSGLQYLDIENRTLYMWVDGTGDVANYGWTQMGQDSGGSFVWTDTSAAEDHLPHTMGGNGTKEDPLHVLSVIEDYVSAKEPYPVGAVVTGSINFQYGIYKREEGNVRVWQRYGPTVGLGMKHLVVNQSQVFNPGDYFYVDQLGNPNTLYNGIYQVHPDLTSGISILITPTDVHDLVDHIDGANATVEFLTDIRKGAAAPCKEWQPDTSYHPEGLEIRASMVYTLSNGVPDYSRLYIYVFSNDTPLYPPQHEFNEFAGQHRWRLLADVGGGGGGGMSYIPGMMMGWLWSDPAKPTDPELPPGWLKCDGTNVSRAVYNLLFNVVGNNYNDENTPGGAFKLPTAYNMMIYSGVL